jgi:hypothetical protein
MNVSSSTSLNPALATMLAQLTPSNAAASPPAIAPAASSASPAAGVGTGSGKASVSDAILNLFSQMHQASGSAHHGGGAGGAGESSSTGGSTTTASTASTMMNPLNQLMAALGVDEDESAEAADTGSDLSMFYSSSNKQAADA